MVFVPPVKRPVYKTQEAVHTVQPKRHSKNQPPASFVKFQNQNLYLGPGKNQLKYFNTEILICTIYFKNPYS